MICIAMLWTKILALVVMISAERYRAVMAAVAHPSFFARPTGGPVDRQAHLHLPLVSDPIPSPAMGPIVHKKDGCATD